MDQFLGKSFKLKSLENYEENLKFLGVQSPKLEFVLAVIPTLKFTQNSDGSYTLAVSVAGNDSKIPFKLGEEFEDTMVNGAKVKSKFFLEGNNLIHTQIDEGGKKYLNVMEFKPTAMTTTITADGWNGKCIKYYELVA